MTPEQQAIGALWVALTALGGGALRYLANELRECRKECRDDRETSTTALQGLTTALNKVLETKE